MDVTCSLAFISLSLWPLDGEMSQQQSFNWICKFVSSHLALKCFQRIFGEIEKESDVLCCRAYCFALLADSNHDWQNVLDFAQSSQLFPAPVTENSKYRINPLMFLAYAYLPSNQLIGLKLSNDTNIRSLMQMSEKIVFNFDLPLLNGYDPDHHEAISNRIIRIEWNYS